MEMNETGYCPACKGQEAVSLKCISDGHLYKCVGCGTLRLLPFNNISVEKNILYGEAYRKNNDPKKNSRINIIFNNIIKKHFSNKGSLIDIGCGDGTFLSYAKEDGWDVFGLDCDPIAVENVNKLGIPTLLGNLGDPVKLEKTFDVSTLWDVIEHIPNPEKAVEWLSNRINPGGKVILVTPNVNSLIDKIAHFERNITYHKSQRLINLCLNRYHLYRFSSKGLKLLFERFGFKTVTVDELQLFSLIPESYLGAFAPGINSWTRFNFINKHLSRWLYSLINFFHIKNKILYVAVRNQVSQRNDQF